MPSPEASRRNGRLGGRHKKPPQLVPEMMATRKRNIELRELCKVNDAKHVATLEWLAANSESHFGADTGNSAVMGPRPWQSTPAA